MEDMREVPRPRQRGRVLNITSMEPQPGLARELGIAGQEIARVPGDDRHAKTGRGLARAPEPHWQPAAQQGSAKKAGATGQQQVAVIHFVTMQSIYGDRQ